MRTPIYQPWQPGRLFSLIRVADGNVVFQATFPAKDKAEKKSRDFDPALDSVQKIVFSIGGYFGGYDIKTYLITGDQVLLDMEHSLKTDSCNSLCVHKS